jgi:hypothetical protein
MMRLLFVLACLSLAQAEDNGSATKFCARRMNR